MQQLLASQSYQNAYLFEEKGHSIFTYYLIEALKGNEESVDNNGYVTPYSLNKYIFKKINSLPSKKRPQQKPLMKAETSGDIILAYYPQLAKKLYPEHPAASIDTADIISRGNRYLDNREYNKALEYYEKIVSDPNLAKAWNNKGSALLQLRKYEESLQAFDISIGLDPNNAHAWSNKGMALHNQGRFDEAIKCLQKSIDLNPTEFARWEL
ncbi:hypothetical protein BH18THE2_BH18THE2_29620 [soil metagenome]